MVAYTHDFSSLHLFAIETVLELLIVSIRCNHSDVRLLHSLRPFFNSFFAKQKQDQVLTALKSIVFWIIPFI